MEGFELFSFSPSFELFEDEDEGSSVLDFDDFEEEEDEEEEEEEESPVLDLEDLEDDRFDEDRFDFDDFFFDDRFSEEADADSEMLGVSSSSEDRLAVEVFPSVSESS